MKTDLVKVILIPIAVAVLTHLIIRFIDIAIDKRLFNGR